MALSVISKSLVGSAAKTTLLATCVRSLSATSRLQNVAQTPAVAPRPPRDTEFTYQKRVYQAELKDLRKQWLAELKQLEMKKKEETAEQDVEAVKQIEEYRRKKKETRQANRELQEARAAQFAQERRQLREVLRQHKVTVDKSRERRIKAVSLQQEQAGTFITATSLDVAIQQAIGQPVSYNNPIPPQNTSGGRGNNERQQQKSSAGVEVDADVYDVDGEENGGNAGQ